MNWHMTLPRGGLHGDSAGPQSRPAYATLRTVTVPVSPGGESPDLHIQLPQTVWHAFVARHIRSSAKPDERESKREHERADG
ncbi:hypothetical protein ACIP10_26050 [Streptomyces galbus]|uniref:hypothetical protein n=1 Tax=Streptomyces galbus TaxID=33898 RepID=UPI00382B30C1